MRVLHLSSVWLAIGAAGCQDAATLSVEAGSAEVDTNCANGGCETPPVVALRVTVEAENNPNATVEILQYRVDYDLPDAEGLMPFFAAPIDLEVMADGEAVVSVAVAGARQREWAIQEVGFSRVSGTATIQLAGYDDEDQRVDAETTFDIAFGDFGAGSSDAGTEMDGGAP